MMSQIWFTNLEKWLFIYIYVYVYYLYIYVIIISIIIICNYLYTLINFWLCIIHGIGNVLAYVVESFKTDISIILWDTINPIAWCLTFQ